MRLFISIALLASVSSSVLAHHPDRENQPVHPRIEVIPPLGNALPMSHRRRYNRPSNWMGKIAYYVAPSSQEAMAWHNATHRGYYKSKSPRMVTHYFYPKPWEGLRIGPRRPTLQDGKQQPTPDPRAMSQAAEMIPSPTETEAPAIPDTATSPESDAGGKRETGDAPAESLEADAADESEAATSPSSLAPPKVNDTADEAIAPSASSEPPAAE